jgi:hypothetical protein
MPFKSNAARRHHIPKQRHWVTNWSEYHAALRQRGSEPRQDSRRLRLLTGWSHDEANTLLFTRGPRAGGSNGFRAPGRVRLAPWTAGIGPLSIISLRRCRCSSLKIEGWPGALPSRSPSGPWALKRSTQLRTVCRPTPPISAAWVRELPSSITARASRRRVCGASLLRRASWRRRTAS